MKTVRTRKFPIKNNRQEILRQTFGGDRGRVKPFSEDDRGEDRRFETSLPGFRNNEEEHEASGHLSKIVARVTQLTVKVKLENPLSKSRERIVDKALVDTESTFTVVPRSIATKLGLRSLGKRRVETANRSQLCSVFRLYRGRREEYGNTALDQRNAGQDSDRCDNP